MWLVGSAVRPSEGWALSRGQEGPRPAGVSGERLGERRGQSQRWDGVGAHSPLAQRYLGGDLQCHLPNVWDPRGQNPLCPGLRCVPVTGRVPAAELYYPKSLLTSHLPAHLIDFSPDTSHPPAEGGWPCHCPSLLWMRKLRPRMSGVCVWGGGGSLGRIPKLYIIH